MHYTPTGHLNNLAICLEIFRNQPTHRSLYIERKRERERERCGHRIQNGICGLEVDIEFKMGIWTRAFFGPGLLGPSVPGTGSRLNVFALAARSLDHGWPI